MFNKLELQKGFWIDISIMISTVVGALTNNIEIWLPLGIVIGASHASIQNK